MAKKIFGFNKKSDFQRTQRAVKKVENMPRTGARRNRTWPHGNSGGPRIRRGIVLELGDYDVHRVGLLSGTFTQDLTTDDLGHDLSDTEAYVASEFDYHLEVGDVVLLAEIEKRYWIFDAEPDCNGYCISEDFYDGAGYVWGWSFRAPNLPCCPEAGGIQLLTTSDGGTTYETATFQCNSDGTDRKWFFKDRKLRLTPRLDEGNIEYWTDNPPGSCTVQLQQYEPQLYPKRDDCGKVPASVCLHPMCGAGSCAGCNNTSPMSYTVIIGSGGQPTDNYVTPSENCGKCAGTVVTWRKIQTGDLSDNQCFWGVIDNPENAAITGVTITYTDPPVMTVACDYDAVWSAEGPFDCTSEIILTFDETRSGTESLRHCEGFPQTIKVVPTSPEVLEGNCYPISISHLWDYNFQHDYCPRLPYVMEFEVDGVTDNTCDSCDEFNNQYRIVMRQALTYPIWRSVSVFSITCSEVTGHTQMRWYLYVELDPPNDPYLILKVGGDDGGAVSGYHEVLYIGPRVSDFNCFGKNVFTLDDDQGNCATWPATITVTSMLPTI